MRQPRNTKNRYAWTSRARSPKTQWSRASADSAHYRSSCARSWRSTRRWATRNILRSSQGWRWLWWDVRGKKRPFGFLRRCSINQEVRIFPPSLFHSYFLPLSLLSLYFNGQSALCGSCVRSNTTMDAQHSTFVAGMVWLWRDVKEKGRRGY